MCHGQDTLWFSSLHCFFGMSSLTLSSYCKFAHRPYAHTMKVPEGSVNSCGVYSVDNVCKLSLVLPLTLSIFLASYVVVCDRLAHVYVIEMMYSYLILLSPYNQKYQPFHCHHNFCGRTIR